MHGVFADDFDEHAVGSGHVVTIYYFRDFFQFFYHVIIHGTFVEIHTQKCGNAISELKWVHHEVTTFDKSNRVHFLHTDVNGAR